jgi:probable phosphoglycerate mutase
MGSQDIPLNEFGLQQAHEASRVMENKSFDVIVSSTKMRAQQTAEVIAQRTNRPILLKEGLVEITWGEAEGTFCDPMLSLLDDTRKPKGAETFFAFQKRVVETITSILLMGKLPLIVSHGAVFKALTRHMGYPDLSSSNCIPFFFKPPCEPTHPWIIGLLRGDEN